MLEILRVLSLIQQQQQQEQSTNTTLKLPFLFLECPRPLGMENFEISDGKITASSETDHNPAKHGRLNFKKGSWSAVTDDSSQWLQIDLGDQNTKVTKVATQGKKGKGEWVKEYKLQYSEDGEKFQYYREQGQSAEKVKLISLPKPWQL